MGLIFLLFLALVLSFEDDPRIFARSEDSLDCKDIVSKSPLLQLKRHLFCEYDSTIRPVVKQDSAVNVSIYIMPKFMEFDDHLNKFTLHAWMYFEWNDSHLQWNKEDFNNVNDIRVRSNEVWVPDFSVYNSGNMEFFQKGIPDTDCVLYSDGKIFCVPAMKYTTQCVGNYQNWPYDKQNCTIRFGSWSHTGEEMNFELDHNGISTDDLTPHPFWDVKRMNVTKHVSKYSCCPNDTFPFVILEVNLERHSRRIHAVYVTPAIVLMLLTLSVLWMDPKSFERIALVCIAFVCHLLILYNMHWEVPNNGPNIPHIIIFYRNSLLLVSFAMIVTSVSRKLYSMAVMPPRWISSVISFVLNYRAGQVLLKNKEDVKNLADGETEDDAEPPQAVKIVKGDANWRGLSLIIDWLTLFIVAFTYVIMLIVLIPLKNDYAPDEDEDADI